MKNNYLSSLTKCFPGNFLHVSKKMQSLFEHNLSRVTLFHIVSNSGYQPRHLNKLLSITPWLGEAAKCLQKLQDNKSMKRSNTCKVIGEKNPQQQQQ